MGSRREGSPEPPPAQRGQRRSRGEGAGDVLLRQVPLLMKGSDGGSTKGKLGGSVVKCNHHVGLKEVLCERIHSELSFPAWNGIMSGKGNLVTFLREAFSLCISEGKLDASTCLMGLQSEGISPLCPVSRVRGHPWDPGCWDECNQRTWAISHTGSQCDSVLQPQLTSPCGHQARARQWSPLPGKVTLEPGDFI